MQKISVKNQKFLKNSFEPSLTSSVSIPFLFSVDLKTPKLQKSSFNTELRKITQKIGPILDKNTLKLTEGFQKPAPSIRFHRRGRSYSPIKEELKPLPNNLNLFPCGAPIVPIPLKKPEDDEELKLIKEEYFKMIDSAQETKPTEEAYDEEEQYILNIISSLCTKTKKCKIN